MDALGFYQLADWLITNRRSSDGNTSLKRKRRYRISVSRAYYSAFHSALLFLGEMGLHIPHSDNKHEKLPMILDGAEDSAIEEAAERLRTLRENRSRADDQLDKPEFESEAYAQVQVKDAARVIGAIGTCRSTRGPTDSRHDKVREAVTREFRLKCLGIR
jgi:hypothetical protein